MQPRTRGSLSLLGRCWRTQLLSLQLLFTRIKAALGCCSFCTATRLLCILRFVLKEAVTAEGAKRSWWLDASPPAHPCTGHSYALQEGEDPFCLFSPLTMWHAEGTVSVATSVPLSCPLLNSCSVFPPVDFFPCPFRLHCLR